MRHPDARKLDLKGFVFRPIPRLLRYDLLLRAVMKTLPEGHEDLETIPQILDLIKDLGKAVDAGVSTATKKVELWNYNSNLIFKPGEAVVGPVRQPPRAPLKLFLIGHGSPRRDEDACSYRPVAASTR